MVDDVVVEGGKKRKRKGKPGSDSNKPDHLKETPGYDYRFTFLTLTKNEVLDVMIVKQEGPSEDNNKAGGGDLKKKKFSNMNFFL